MSKKEISTLAYQKWEKAGKPDGQDLKFWLEAESEFTLKKPKEKKTVVKEENNNARYIAVKGLREIARDNDLRKLVEKVAKLEVGNHAIGTSDLVIWDTGTVTFPMMSLVASTCRGWLPINVKGREYLPASDLFGISLTPREMIVLKQLFEVWNLEGGQSVSDAVKNIYEQTYIKDFKPGPGQIRLNRDEFKVFVGKLLGVLNSVPGKEPSDKG